MIPTRKLAETRTADNATLALYEHDGSFCIRLDGQDVMNSRTCASELLLGEVSCTGFPDNSSPRVLIGGLGLGFTLLSALKALNSSAIVEVAELFPEVISWNREFLYDLNGKLLDDPRVQIITKDVFAIIQQAERSSYDAIVLDIDNGPRAMVQQSNARLYSRRGIERIAAALKPGGRVSIWSASKDPAFEQRLASVGFRVRLVPAKTHPQAKRDAFTIYLATRSAS